MSIESFTFSTRDVSAEDRFGAYHDLYAAGSDVGRTHEDFYAHISAYRFSRMLVFNRRISGAAHARTARVRRDGFDHFTLQLLRSGRLVSDIASTGRALAPGEILLSDMTRQASTRLDKAHLVTISLARELVELAVPNPGSLHGVVLPAGPAGLLADFVGSLARRAPQLNAEWAKGTPLAFASLLKGAVSASKLSHPDALDAATGPEPAAVLDAFRLERLQAFIETHLVDPDLSVDRIASGAAMSRTALYRVFEPLGGVASYIQTRRLARLRAALFRQTERRPIATLAFAHGFASESHCNRAFRKAYGLPPGQFRKERARDRGLSREGSSARDTLASWIGELF